MVCHHPAKFGGHRYCGSRDMFLVCHKISQDHTIKGLCDYINRNASRSVTNMTILVAIGTVVVEIW